MAIRIERNEAGNCINFHGASNPSYWNACLSGEVDSSDANTVNVINDIITAQTGDTEYEYFRVPFTEFIDADGNGFADAQATADYITEKANVIGLSGEGISLVGETVCFSLDPTSTSIMLDNGFSFGVNTIKAVDVSGLINIVSNDGADDITHFYQLDPINTCVNGNPVSGGLNDVINTLNELFTVGAFESIVISDPYSTMVADVSGVDTSVTYAGYGIDPVGTDVYGSTSSNSQNGFKTTETIDQAGEYFTFDIRVEGTIGFGLIHTQASYDDGYWSGNSNYADPTRFGIDNSAHYGFQFSHWFHPTPNGSWTNYGANTSFSYGAGWNNFNGSAEQTDWLNGDPIKVRVGIDSNGFISIETLRNGTDWVVHARTSYPIQQGAEFHLGIKTNHTGARVYSLPKVHLLEVDDTPTAIGDTNITLLGDATGTLDDGIATPSGNDLDNGFITEEGLSASGEYFEFEVNLGSAHTVSLVDANTHSVATISADTSIDLITPYVYFGQPINNLGAVTLTHDNWSGLPATVGNRFAATHFRIGFDNQGKLTVWSSSDGVNFIVSKHLSSAAVSGDYRLMYIGRDAGATFESLSKGQLSQAPTMYFRYIESPDGVFHYPLFATEEEANYFDLQNGGTGTNSTNVYPDEPTFATWYEPTNGHTHDGTAAPTSAILFEGNAINWTEITSVTNADLAPPSFLDWNLTINELGAVNIAVAPADAGFTTTIVDNDGSGLTLIGLNVEGTAPEVTGDYSSNPSDVYTIGVVRTNSYGSTTATITLTVVNLTAPVTAISGFNYVSGTTAMIDSDTMDDGSVVYVNSTVADGERFVIEKAYVQDNILPSLNAVNDKYIIGLSNQPETFGTLELTDFDTAIVWEYESANSHTFKFYRDGSVVQNIVINSMTQAFYDYAIEVNGTSAWLIACNLNNIMNEASPADGGTFSHTYEATSIEDTAPVTIHMATLNTSGDISTDDIETISTPDAPVSNLTSWTKALDFSGSNEHLKQVANWITVSPLRMNDYATNIAAPTTTGYTAYGSSVRPWATAVVFKTDGNNSNQHIWNQGEGAGTGDDNIYVRLSSSGQLYFGWGREGDSKNECLIGGISNNRWYGLYIGHNGRRMSSSDATAANLSDTFDIRLMYSTDSFNTVYTHGTTTQWTNGSTGGRMDRSYTGDFTIGGRGSNRSFHGKVASMVVTTLRIGQPMPTDAEIKAMITDPKKWVDDYKVGNSYRPTYQAGDFPNFQYGTETTGRATQMWLMGDGTFDSYANGIRNQISYEDQNNNKLQLNSMVSNDFENVNITGLS